jgi:hypothetical protein
VDDVLDVDWDDEDVVEDVLVVVVVTGTHSPSVLDRHPAGPPASNLSAHTSNTPQSSSP